MKTLLYGGTVVNVFTKTLEKENVLIEDGKIIGVGNYTDADIIEDVSGKYICPGFIDGHIHIESTMMTPSRLCSAAIVHGTTAIVTDPHEIANVCGTDGIKYMLETSNGLPMNVYVMLPSCVPATHFDESGAILEAEVLKKFYDNPRVLGLAEMMNYPGLIGGSEKIRQKIRDAKKAGKIVDGHAPMLSGPDLDKYISEGIKSDHECSDFAEATERIRKGQWIMLRQGTAARNLAGLINLFDEPWNHRCLLVTDDRHPADFLGDGHIDSIIRSAAEMGKSALTGIQMATINAATYFGIADHGAVAPGYKANILVLSDIDTVDVCDVYSNGIKVVDNKKAIPVSTPPASEELENKVLNSFCVDKLSKDDFYIHPDGNKCRVIKVIPDQLLTDEWIADIDFDNNNGIDTQKDILKIAVIERHRNTGHKGVGFISGIGLKTGAIASSVSHDSHNLIVIGTNDDDMAIAANRIIELGGGYVVVENQKVLSELPLPIAGLMTDMPAEEIAKKDTELRNIIHSLGVPDNIAPLMNMAFVSLSVIPHLKMTTRGLIDVNKQRLVPLFVE